MQVIKWAWCLHCERCFEAHLSREPEANEGAINFIPDLETQLGIQKDGETYAECPYEGCDGSPLDFWWWDRMRGERPELPEVPVEGQVYPLYPGPVRPDVWREIEERVGKLRADYLDAAIKVESVLESVLASLICPVSTLDAERPLRQPDRNTMVRNAVLRHRDVTFRTKRDFLNVLGQWLDDVSLVDAADQVTKVMERRNSLAHRDWALVADSETDFELVNVKPDGRRTSTLVTPAIVNDWLLHAGQTEHALWDLYTDLNPWIRDTLE